MQSTATDGEDAKIKAIARRVNVQKLVAEYRAQSHSHIEAFDGDGEVTDDSITNLWRWCRLITAMGEEEGTEPLLTFGLAHQCNGLVPDFMHDADLLLEYPDWTNKKKKINPKMITFITDKMHDAASRFIRDLVVGHSKQTVANVLKNGFESIETSSPYIDDQTMAPEEWVEYCHVISSPTVFVDPMQIRGHMQDFGLPESNIRTDTADVVQAAGLVVQQLTGLNVEQCRQLTTHNQPYGPLTTHQPYGPHYVPLPGHHQRGVFFFISTGEYQRDRLPQKPPHTYVNMTGFVTDKVHLGHSMLVQRKEGLHPEHLHFLGVMRPGDKKGDPHKILLRPAINLKTCTVEKEKVYCVNINLCVHRTPQRGLSGLRVFLQNYMLVPPADEFHTLQACGLGDNLKFAPGKNVNRTVVDRKTQMYLDLVHKLSGRNM